MALAASAASQSPLALSFILKHKSPSFPAVNRRVSPTFQSRQCLERRSNFPSLAGAAIATTSQSFKICANNGVFLLSEAIAVNSSQELVPTTTGEDGVSTIISALLGIAFIGLSILTIGVIYLAVTDYLQKREGEKFAKEEAAKKKKSVKKARVGRRVPGRARGFGQKIEEEEDEAE